MQYPAILTREGGRTLIAFPDCPGCQTFAEPGEDVQAVAQEALEGWLEVGLEDGEAPPRPASRRVRRVLPGKAAYIQVSPNLAVALLVRWARQDAKLSQADLARKMGVSQQQAAKLEQPDTNPTLETLAKVAKALNVNFDISVKKRTGRERVAARA